MQLPNREARSEPEKQGWLVWDSANGAYRRSTPRVPKKLRRKIMKALKALPQPQVINA